MFNRSEKTDVEELQLESNYPESEKQVESRPEVVFLLTKSGKRAAIRYELALEICK